MNVLVFHQIQCENGNCLKVQTLDTDIYSLAFKEAMFTDIKTMSEKNFRIVFSRAIEVEIAIIPATQFFGITSVKPGILHFS
jgi:hypothetical protein